MRNNFLRDVVWGKHFLEQSNIWWKAKLTYSCSLQHPLWSLQLLFFPWKLEENIHHLGRKALFSHYKWNGKIVFPVLLIFHCFKRRVYFMYFKLCLMLGTEKHSGYNCIWQFGIHTHRRMLLKRGAEMRGESNITFSRKEVKGIWSNTPLGKGQGLGVHQTKMNRTRPYVISSIFEVANVL